MKQFLLFLLLLSLSAGVFSQDSTKNNVVSLTGFVDFYYQYDFANPGNKERPEFLYNYKRHNEFNINLALIKAAYTNNKVRANVGLMVGNYPQYNLAAELPLMQHIYEANAGYAFSDKISIDAGIFSSHIGLESAISKDNWNLSRSIIAENTPYYETGIKLNYVPTEKWTASFLLLNGWQNIKETNSGKAIGTQLQFKPNEKWLLNSSTFIGNEKPDSAKQLRLFHNFYTTYAITKKWNAAFLFDIGKEKHSNWFGTALLLQHSFTKKLNTACRIEYYKDKKGIIVSINQASGFQTTGFSWNIDYCPAKNIYFRTEVRYFHSANAIFLTDGLPKKNNSSVLGSIAVAL